MSNKNLVLLILGIIGLVLGTFFLLIHIFLKRRNDQNFSHFQKAETIMGHIRKYYLFMLSIMFYCMSASGFVPLILHS